MYSYAQEDVAKMPIMLHEIILRSSHQRCSVRKDVLRNFAKFTGKTLVPESLFQ